MNPEHLSVAQWTAVCALFDELVDQPPERREVDSLDHPQSVRNLLKKMLAAHDSADAQLLDHTVSSIAESLFLADGGKDQAVDYRDRMFGPWRALEEIGRGGMAVVLRGERADGQFEKEVAIKLLPQAGSGNEQERLLEEIRILARLEHPNIARLIDGGIDQKGTPYLVMEYVRGVPITAYCRQHGLHCDARVVLFEQVIQAVRFAHRNLIVHCDIKPDNVLVSDEGQVKLLDFGIASLISTSTRSEPATRGLLCSPGYCAPEQMQGASPATTQDVHNLGAVLFELLYLRRIRDNQTVTRLLFGARAPVDPVEPPARHQPGLDRDLSAICNMALATAPDQRYPTAEALLDDLHRWRKHLPVVARDGSPAYRAGKWIRRYRLPATAAAIVIVALIVGSGLALWQAGLASLEAEQARHEAARANTVKEFLLSLFRAGDPLATGGAVLDTREVFARGAEQIREDTHLALDIRIEILNTLADVQRTLDWNEDALEMLLEAQALAESVSDPPPMPYAETLYQRGAFAAHATSELDQAIDWHTRALAAIPDSPEYGPRRMQARTLIARGGVHARLGQLDASAADLDQADKLLGGLNPPDLELEMLLSSSLGVGAYNAGNYEQAYRHMQNTAGLQRRLGNEKTGSMVMTLSNLGAVASVLGRLDEAVEYDREAVAIAKRVYPAGHHQIGWSLYALGDTLRQTGQLEEAQARLGEAREIFEAADQPARVEAVNLVLARILIARGDADAALELARRLRPILAHRYGETAIEVLRIIEVEIAAAAMAGQVDALASAEQRAGERLAQIPPSHLWSPVAQQLRWRLGASALTRSDLAVATRWLEESRRAPPDAPGNTTVDLLLGGLSLRLAAAGQLNPDNEAIEHLARLADDESASADARLYAWISIALAQQRLDNPDQLRRALAHADEIASGFNLSTEMLEDLQRSRLLVARN